ncbi:MAG: NUDIX hydrolase [Gammaproteobacteria bacterium]|nr:NUDIX hydrolase [Gammaproteobacteria bacterium]
MNDRSFQPHVTVAAVSEQDGHFLVVHEYVNGAERINNPAGHIEDGESPEAAVVREVMEETGYHFVPESLGGIYVWRRPDNSETFVRCNVIGHCDGHDADAVLDAGIIGPQWYSLRDLQNREAMLRSPLVLRSFREYLDGVRYPLGVITTLIGP